VHDHFHRLDPPVYLLLAPGYFGLGIVPNCLVDIIAIPAARHCLRWCIRTFEIDHYAPCKIDQKDIAGDEL